MTHEYLVQKWFGGKAATWQRISANGKLDAAERVTGINSGLSASLATFARAFA